MYIVYLSEVECRIPGFFNVQKCAEKFFSHSQKYTLTKNLGKSYMSKSFLHTCTKKSYKYLRSHTICTQSLSFFNSVQVLLQLTVHLFSSMIDYGRGGGVWGDKKPVDVCTVQCTRTLLFTPHPQSNMSLHKSATPFNEKYKYDVTYTSL